MLIGGAVLLVAVLIALVLLLTRGGGTDSPQATSESFIAAVEDRDCDAVQELVTEKLSNEIGDCGGSADVTGTGGELGDPDVVEEGEDTATVHVPIDYPGGDAEELEPFLGSFELSLSLVKEEGAWLVDEVGVAGFEDLEEDLEELPEDEPTG